MALKPKLAFIPPYTPRTCAVRCSSVLAAHSSGNAVAHDVRRTQARLPTPPPAQLTVDRELYYGHLILRALLASSTVANPTLAVSNGEPPNAPEREPDNGQSEPISDREWELRTGTLRYAPEP